MRDNHMIEPFADDDAVSIEHCDKHDIDFDASGCCPDCYLDWRHQDLQERAAKTRRRAHAKKVADDLVCLIRDIAKP